MALAGRITKVGLKALQNGEIDDPNMELMLLVMANVDMMTKDNCIRICIQLRDDYGSSENAIQAIHDGDVQFIKTN
jgi:hypothetical protein